MNTETNKVGKSPGLIFIKREVNSTKTNRYLSLKTAHKMREKKRAPVGAQIIRRNFIMKYEEFLNEVKEQLTNMGMNVEIRHVEKVQNQSYTGIEVKPENSNIGLNVDLYKYYEVAQSGAPMFVIMKFIKEAVEDGLKHVPKVNMEALADYEQAKHSLTMQAISIKQNREILKGLPYKALGDIAIIYRLQIDYDNESALALVTKNMLDSYGITEEQLIKDAEEFAPVNDPIILRTIDEVITQMMGRDPSLDITASGMNEEILKNSPLVVATVQSGVLGAGILGYPNFFELAAEKVGDRFFILPSSIHEIILTKDNGDMDADALVEMVTTINAAAVPPEEQLTDNVYHYDARTKVFESVVKKHMSD